MDGKELLYQLRQALNEQSDSRFLDDKTSYMYLWKAATEFVARTNTLTTSQTITTVASQENYSLNANFLKLLVMDKGEDPFIKYTDSNSSDYFIPWKDYDEIRWENQTTAVSVPNYFTIRDKQSLFDRITGTASAAGSASAGESTLTDTSSSTKFSNVSAGDIVHNTTDGADGIVISKTSNTALVTALFGGSGNDWAQSDAYVIQPQGRMELILNPPPTTAGDTITFEYVCIPDPVFSSYGMYRFPQAYMDVILKYAAWLYKYKDRDPEYGDMWYRQYEGQIRRIVNNLRSVKNKNRLHVSFRKT